MPRAVILTALSVEYLAVRTHLRELREETHPQGTIYERGKFIAKDREWEVGIAEVGAGNAGAAVETERAIAYFQPNILFFIGIAGGIKDVAIGDVVIATDVYSYESGKVGEQFLTRPKVVKSAYALVQRAKLEVRKREWLRRLSGSPISHPRAFVAPIAAGEKVVASKQSDLFNFLRSSYNDAIAVEMEGFGFSIAAFANPKIEAIVIRGISDLIEGKNDASPEAGQEPESIRQEKASRHASAFAFEMLANLQETSKNSSFVPDQNNSSTFQPNVASSFSGKVKIQVCRRLGSDWLELADYLEIPEYERRRFKQGYEGQEIWEWLQKRERLEDLKTALKYLNREDLVDLLEETSKSSNSVRNQNPFSTFQPSQTAKNSSQSLVEPLRSSSFNLSTISTNPLPSRRNLSTAEIDFDEAFKLAEKAYKRRTGNCLNDVQRAILKGTWQGLKYEKIALVYKYEYVSIKQRYAPRLWELLSEAFKEKVNKSNFKEVVKKHFKTKVGSTSVRVRRKKPQKNNPWHRIFTLSEHTSLISAVALSSDSKTIASGSQDGQIKLWDIQTRTCIKTLGESFLWPTKHSKSVNALTFSPDNQILASGSEDRTVIVWSINQGKPLYKPLPHQNSVYSIAISPDGRWLASSGAEPVIKIFEINRSNLVKTLPGHRRSVRSLLFHPNGQLLISAGEDKFIKLWKPLTGKREQTLPESVYSANFIASSASGHFFAICYANDDIEVKNFQTGEDLYSLKGRLIAFSSDDRTLATALDNTIRIWDRETGDLKYPEFCVGKGIIQFLAFGDTENTIILSKHDAIEVWEQDV